MANRKDEICGVCDICLANKKNDPKITELNQQILEILQKNPLNYRDLAAQIKKYSEEKVIEAIRNLDETGEVKMDKTGLVSLV